MSLIQDGIGGSCSHSNSIWIDAWRFYCVSCGSVQLRSKYIGTRRNKKGDVVSQMDASAAFDKSVGGPVRVLHATVATPPVSVYLAHGHSEPTKGLGLDIQAQLEEHGIHVINPFQRKEQQHYEQYMDKGLDFPPSICQEIVEMDLAKIDLVQGVVSIPNTDSIGTYMELFYASYMKHMPCFVLWIHGGRRHPWLSHLTKLYMNDRVSLINDVIKWKETIDGARKTS